MAIYIEDFLDAEIAYFNADRGIVVCLDTDRLIVFKKTMHGWVERAFPLREMRSYAEKVMTPAELRLISQSSGFKGAGEAINVMALNSKERKKAAAETGVEFSLKSTEMPKFFVNVPDRSEREAFIEALNQALHDGEVIEPFGDIPDEVQIQYRKPTENELRDRAKVEEQHIKEQTADTAEFLKHSGSQQEATKIPISRMMIYLILGCFVLLTIISLV